ncbi:ribonuclease III [Roseococcus sp. SDR]|uniref:ribonuclease III n=1 Tax=Roseococcus sp. SDR TaxID=2835532 RepID=UPI001BCCFE44|nr:ribonuclease III [Roseococcus sp. SDR]MBS7791944.1 ribonuclease III [Roseococcus sp. SDR]MBV1847258.1 ribonuclease III [Roseococcus sp. SDR]
MTAGLQQRLGHSFRDPGLLEHALTHRSAADPRRRMLDSNERLEFLGDRVLGLCIAEWLAERFPQEREGDLGKRLATLCSQEVIAPIAERMGLAAALRVPPSEGRTGLRARATVLADALEAVLGALYLDGGLDVARAVVRREWAEAMAVDAKPPVSAKNRLQEWTLGRGLGLPEYAMLSTSGPSHAPVFVVQVTAAGRSAEGMGESKRAAEQAAAEAWLSGIST